LGLFQQIIFGATWNIIGQVAGQIVSLGTVMVLARLLNPEDFGLVAMCYVVKVFAYIFASMGIGSAIIQRKNIDDIYLSTAYWVTFVAGIFIAVALAAASPIVAWFFKRTELVGIVIATSVIFFLGGISSIHRELLEKRMLFKHLSITDLLGAIAGSVVAILMALKGMGYWSLVAQEIAAIGFKVPLLWKLTGWRPKLVFSRDRFKDLFGFSSYVLLSNVINFLNRNGDNIIIGRFLGATQLGFYDIAYNLMLKPLQYISYTTSRVLFPALSQIQDDKEMVRQIYIQTVRLISLMTFPMMIGLSILAPDLIILVYGPKWGGAIPVFKVLCFVGLWQSISTTVGTVLLSQGRSKLSFKMTMGISPFVWIAFIVGSLKGILGVAVAYAIVSGTWWFISHYITNRIIDLPMLTFLGALKPAFFGSIFMAAILFLLTESANQFLTTNLIRIAVCISVGVLSYLIYLMITRNPELIKLFYEVKKRVNSMA